MKFKYPKHGHFYCYCYMCKHWEYLQSIGVAHIGICLAIKTEPEERDAYDKTCGLWTGKKKRKSKCTNVLSYACKGGDYDERR